MTQETLDLNSWITRVQKAGTAKDVLVILDEFRPLSWTNDDRARMAKAYVRVLERIGMPADAEQDDSVAAAAEEDGPVWYEKM